MASKGILTVISGFSGVGKGTVTKGLIKKYPEYRLSISATTRSPREGETDGVEYFFLTKPEFESRIKNGDFIEWAEYVGNYYGTPKSYVEEQLEQGHDIILEIEVQGALNVKKAFPDAVLIFIGPPDFMELKNRLLSRNTESEEVVNKRLQRAADESMYIFNYMNYIINDEVDECIEKIRTVIRSQHFRIENNKDNIDSILKEIELFKKGEM